MNKLCLTNEDESPVDSEDTYYYIEGYKLNYKNELTSSSSCSSTSTSDFMNLVFEKSVNTPNVSYNSIKLPRTSTRIRDQLVEEDSNRSSQSWDELKDPSLTSTLKPTPAKETTRVLSPSVIRERCRVAIECRNNLICIEGNRITKPKNKLHK